MAHNVAIKKTPVLTKDMRVAKGKYTYRVKCKACGVLCPDVKSEGLAELAKANHHVDVHNRHHGAHPNDKAHARSDQNKLKKARLHA